MPIHLVPYLLSSKDSPSLVHPNAFILLLFLICIVVLRRWSRGRDLIARLHIRAREDEEEEERTLRQKQRMGRADADVARGVRMRTAERDLHGLTFLVVCNFTSTSLLLLSSLSSRGAQLILLLPSTAFSSGALSSTMQYLQLLRDGTNNDLIYAESCDMLSLSSIEAFCARWNEGEGGGGTGAGPAGGRAESGLGGTGNAGLSGPSGGIGEEEAEGQASRAPRRCDGLVFLPYTLHQLALSATAADEFPKTSSREHSITLSEREVLGRFHLINSLLSTLLLLPPSRDIRILNWVSPWYAAGVRNFEESERTVGLSDDAVEQNASLREKDSRSLSTGGLKKAKKGSRGASQAGVLRASTPTPLQRSTSSTNSVTISTSGSATLQFLLLLHELQRRLVLLAEADSRPRNPLPGILPTSNSGAMGSNIASVDDLKARGGFAKYPNVNVIDICPGFERDGEVWQYIWPSTSSSTLMGWTSLPMTWLRRLAILLLWPFVGLVFAKSPKHAADQFLWGLVAPIDVRSGCIWVEGVSQSQDETPAGISSAGDDGSRSTPASAAAVGASATTEVALSAVAALPEEDAAGWRGIQPARVYREGKIVNVLPLTSSSPLTKDATTSPSASISGQWYSPRSLTSRWQMWENRARRQRQWERESGKDIGSSVVVGEEEERVEQESHPKSAEEKGEGRR